MISNPGHREAFVWFRLPGTTEPVICGKVASDGGIADVHRFIYGRSYRELAEAVPLLPHALPLTGDEHPTRRGLHGVLRDAAPDAWGRRVLMYRLQLNAARGEAELTEIDYLLSRGQGVGALHFQETGNVYRPKQQSIAVLEEMLQAAEAVETNTAMSADLAEALLHGTSVGGARPKVLLQQDDGRSSIAKFSSSTDIHPVVRLEALALALARHAGIETVNDRCLTVMNKDVLLVDRFDCDYHDAVRRHFYSALTALDLDEMEARYASYPELADYLRRYAGEPVAQCHELYRRMLFNILVGNTDDHARNHALFWDGRFVRLTPAYDLCVIPRIATVASQAMEVGEHGKRATLANALSACGRFGLDSTSAGEMAGAMATSIRDHWQECCEAAAIPEELAGSLWQRSVLSPAIHEE